MQECSFECKHTKKSERITKSEKYFVFDESKKKYNTTKILKIYRHYCH